MKNKFNKFIIILCGTAVISGCADNLGLSGQPVIKTPSDLSGGLPDNSYSDTVQYTQNALVLSVFYSIDSSKLSPGYDGMLQKVINYLNENPNSQIIIQGNASDSGTAKTNMKLSNNRAETVQKYFLSNGAAPYQISTVGYGSSKPFYNDPAKNRRVDIVFKDTENAPDGYSLYKSRIPFIKETSVSVKLK